MTLSLYTGTINYQGDLNPNSFTLRHSHLSVGLILRKPINRWFTVRGGIQVGKIEAADRFNRNYLKNRNLDFITSIQEAHLGLAVTLLDISTKRFTPYAYGGIAVFHFNPWTRDAAGKKTFLKPLSTEGQGLRQYPKQRPYGLIQLSLPFGGGAKFALNDNINIGVEFSQRKTFTDYIDDVSTIYVDHDVLLQAKGPKAVELAYRGDDVPGGTGYPAHGEQRGTPSEMDWYYFFGTFIEVKLDRLGDLFHPKGSSALYLRCPRNVMSY